MRKGKACKGRVGIRLACALALAAGLAVTPAYAAGWSQEGDVWYYYDESGEQKSGWMQAAEDGLWYYLDSETKRWVRRPALDTEAAVRLMENAVKKLGYYQNEEQPVEIREDWRDERTIYMSVRMVTGPNSDTRLNNYEVNRRTGAVKAAVGESFNLYD